MHMYPAIVVGHVEVYGSRLSETGLLTPPANWNSYQADVEMREIQHSPISELVRHRQVFIYSFVVFVYTVE